jgi:hypothetical protein
MAPTGNRYYDDHDRQFLHVDFGADHESSFGDFSADPSRGVEPSIESMANCVGSRTRRGKHRPVLDIDFAARLVPSSTEGHWHLYLDGIELTDRQYEQLVGTLAAIGVVQQGIHNQLHREGQTIVRLPHIRKGGLENTGPADVKTLANVEPF